MSLHHKDVLHFVFWDTNTICRIFPVFAWITFFVYYVVFLYKRWLVFFPLFFLFSRSLFVCLPNLFFCVCLFGCLSVCLFMFFLLVCLSPSLSIPVSWAVCHCFITIRNFNSVLFLNGSHKLPTSWCCMIRLAICFSY